MVCIEMQCEIAQTVAIILNQKANSGDDTKKIKNVKMLEV